MLQFFADQIDQMDLALDQLAMHDRNFDRFALMLIDNVVELTLHKYAQDRLYENDMWKRFSNPSTDPKLVAAALGQNFDSKIKLARIKKLIPPATCDSIQYLHTFRNTAYHRGLRHDGILHSLALFYFKNACTVFSSFSPLIWSSGSGDKISYRAAKYIGKIDFFMSRPTFGSAWKRLSEVAESMNDTMISDLHFDMREIIERTDSSLNFLEENEFGSPKGRASIIIDCQVWPFINSKAGKKYAEDNNITINNTGNYIEQIASSYPWPVKSDPLPSWMNRLDSLAREKDSDAALKKYCDFMKQTDEIRTHISEAESQLDAHIQNMIDAHRDK
ncbi:hypothetical protein ABH905_003222 [Pseudomonas frederiksbergensis]|uniref:hypothetical protein n=1 Tax=Pseudomonas frederiksbergensis TaxID=104087 RepID=UPI003D205E1F